MVALEPGRYTISGIYQTTDNRLNKTINVKSDDVEFELDLEGGCTYSAAMYMYSPEERGSAMTAIQMRMLQVFL